MKKDPNRIESNRIEYNIELWARDHNKYDIDTIYPLYINKITYYINIIIKTLKQIQYKLQYSIQFNYLSFLN